MELLYLTLMDGDGESRRLAISERFGMGEVAPSSPGRRRSLGSHHDIESLPGVHIGEALAVKDHWPVLSAVPALIPLNAVS
jgi:hypothetical protein